MNIRQRILATILYADIFDYPLTSREIDYWMPFGSKANTPVRAAIRHLCDTRVLKIRRGYQMLHNRESLIPLREAREKFSRKKMNIAKKAAILLSRIPTVECVAVTGGVSMNNANREDDIDICIITADHTVWITRLMATVIFDIAGMRRKPKDILVQDKICLNMFWSKSTNPVSVRDWYTAHEILQMRVLFDRGNALRAFLNQNEWVKQLFPVAWRERSRSMRMSTTKGTLVERLFLSFCRILEPIVYVLQLIIMQNRRTTEVITRECIRFHPKDSRPEVSHIFRKRLKQYHVPLANISFFS